MYFKNISILLLVALLGISYIHCETNRGDEKAKASIYAADDATIDDLDNETVIVEIPVKLKQLTRLLALTNGKPKATNYFDKRIIEFRKALADQLAESSNENEQLANMAVQKRPSWAKSRRILWKSTLPFLLEK